MNPTDILVIGAGVNGLASALSLAQAGLSVRIIDSGAGGRESSWAGAGILSALPPWDYAPAVTALIDYSLALWPAWLADVRQHSRVDPQFIQSGMLILDPADPAAAHAWCAAHPDACAPVPAALAHHAATALWLPKVAQARNPRLLAALQDRVIAAGIEVIVDNGLIDWQHDGPRITGIKTPNGPLSAHRYVVAAGAWSKNILGTLAAGLKVHPVLGQIALLASTPGTVPNILFAGGYYLVPRQDGLVLVGSSLEDCGFNKRTTLAAKAEFIAFAQRLFPALRDAPCVHHWAGLRPGSPDNIPSIGRHPEIENLYVNAGHFRYGVTMAPAAADLLTDIVLNRSPKIDAAPYAWPAV
jgi:glycine oxidase